MKQLRWFRRCLIITSIIALIASGVAWMFFQHIPGWYRPVGLSNAEIQGVQDRLEHTFEIISQQMASGETFSVTFTTRQLNEILSAQHTIWPAATDWLGPRWRTPCVDIEPDIFQFGMRYYWENVQSILSVEVTPRMEDDRLVVELVGLNAGSLPLPRSLLAKGFTDHTEDSPERVEVDRMGASPPGDAPRHLVRHLLATGETVTLDEWFYWPNGDIPFQITAVALAHDQLAFSIQPDIRGLRR